MSRPNKPRSIGDESNLARRIAAERQSRGLSYEGLAKLMTDAGCAIQGSGIYKIEKADPPRRITVNELVAFAQVFAVSVENLLTPIELLELERARQLLGEMDKADAESLSALARSLMVYIDFYTLSLGQPDMAEYIDGHRLHWTEDAELAQTSALFYARDTLKTDDGQLLDAINNLWSCLRAEAKTVADALRPGSPDVDYKHAVLLRPFASPSRDTSKPLATHVAATDQATTQERPCP